MNMMIKMYISFLSKDQLQCQQNIFVPPIMHLSSQVIQSLTRTR